MEAVEKKAIPFAQIQDLLDLAERFNRQMKRELVSSDGNENSLGVRQAKYLRDRYIKELNKILKEFDFNLQSLI